MDDTEDSPTKPPSPANPRSAARGYASLVNSVFGEKSATFKHSSIVGNHVIDGLNNPSQFPSFCMNFPRRLHRLAKHFPSTDASRAALLCQVNEIASHKNWQGAWAELAAYDFLTTDCGWPTVQLFLNANVEGSRTYAAAMGHPGPANLDVHFGRIDAYADVKCLKDNVAEILDGVCREAFVGLTPQPHVLVEWPHDMHYSGVQNNRTKLVNELRDATRADARPNLVASLAVPGLRYILRWTASVATARSFYSPYRHAENTHRLAFLHADKFVKDCSSLLIFVNFPWFNNTVSRLRGENGIFYRSFARRVFCQYKHDTRNAGEFVPGYSGVESLFDVSRKLSAILFLEDCSLLDDPSPASQSGETSLVDAYLFSNPNADFPLFTRSYQGQYFRELKTKMVDTFEYDNY